jgi:hypothetical protein
MKIPIQANTVTFEDLQSKISARFPDYKFNVRSKYFGVVQKTATAGANVVLKKEKIFVTANFPTMIGSGLFMVCIIFLGVLIPIILYYSIFFSAQKKVEKEVGEYLMTEYARKA